MLDWYKYSNIVIAFQVLVVQMKMKNPENEGEQTLLAPPLLF